MEEVQIEIKKGNLDEALSKIPDLIEKSDQIIKKYHELHLSLLAEKIKRADTFYLARATKKEIKPHMMEWIKVYRQALGKVPSWYGAGQNSIENFWLDMRTIWNKAHHHPWNNNRDEDGKLMEYRR